MFQFVLWISPWCRLSEEEIGRGWAYHERIPSRGRSYQCNENKAPQGPPLPFSFSFSFFWKHFFVILQAEVQSIFADGALSLHTRSLKYGKVSHTYMDWKKSECLFFPGWPLCFLFPAISWGKASSCSSLHPWSRGRKHISTICHVVHPLSWGIMALCGSIPRRHNRKRRLGASTPAWRWGPITEIGLRLQS